MLCLALGCQSGGGAPEGEAPGPGSGVPTPSEEGPPMSDTAAPPTETIVITAGIKGYTEPCGCTLDLVLGGIDRVVAFARDPGGPARPLVLDAGNLLFEHDSLDPDMVAQELRKTEVIVAAVDAMGTAATVPGPTDLANGLDFYLRTLGETDVVVVGANIAGRDGLPFAVSYIVEGAGDLRVGVIGAVDPDAFAGSEAVEVGEPVAAVRDAVAALAPEAVDVTVLLFQGDLPAARRLFGNIDGVDFIVVGPRHTDETERVGAAVTLEAFDQGRTVGRLRLAQSGQGHPSEGWVGARAGSDEEIARIERVIAGIREQLDGMPEFAPGEEPPIVARQRERIDSLQADLDAMRSRGLDWSAPRSFDWEPMEMVPDLATHEPTTDAMNAYNLALREINLAGAEAPLAAAPGTPTYVGAQACAGCHAEATAFWQTTAHADAMHTLVERNKQYDRSCVGCHVTGWRRPGGSALGDLRGLADVQCEQCHGPGSMHVATRERRAAEVGIQRRSTVETCVGCHSPEHSTTFDFDSYLARIVGPGHGG